ncbi:MAG: glycosyltransferase [Candidatus Aminicenantes bacterium]|nr:glycosyltransferase [Candidatus Aminicenantes bacterium]
MDVVFFGAYDPDYPRNAVLRRGLELNGVEVSECRVRPGPKFWLRYPLLISRWRRRREAPPSGLKFVLVPEFAQKDVPLARLVGRLTARRVVFDPLASRYETKILDWKRKPEGSFSARWNKAIDRWALRRADLILSDTRAHKDYYGLEFGLDPEKIAVVPVGFDDRIFRRSPANASARKSGPPGPFTVLFFGSFLPLHGVDAVIEAARKVRGMDKGVRFKFIGSGQTFDHIRALASDYGLDNVAFDGWLSQTELAARVAEAADVCLGIFGRTEKAGRVVPHKIYQAMALGKAVITSRTPAVEEFFSHGKNIFLCDEEYAGRLAEAVLELKEDPGLRETLARAGQDLVWEKYRPEAVGSELKRILENASGRNG